MAYNRQEDDEDDDEEEEYRKNFRQLEFTFGINTNKTLSLFFLFILPIVAYNCYSLSV